MIFICNFEIVRLKQTLRRMIITIYNYIQPLDFQIRKQTKNYVFSYNFCKNYGSGFFIILNNRTSNND